MDEALRALALQYAPEEVRAMLAQDAQQFMRSIDTITQRMSGTQTLAEPYEAEAAAMVLTGLDGKYMGLTLTEARRFIIGRELAIAEMAAMRARQARVKPVRTPINLASAKRRRLLR